MGWRALTQAVAAGLDAGSGGWPRPRHPGVRIGYLRDGTEHTLDVDYALLALPLNRLSAIDVDLPDTVRAAPRTSRWPTPSRSPLKLRFAPAEHRPGTDLRLLWPAIGTPRPQRIVTVYGNAMALAQRLPPTGQGKSTRPVPCCVRRPATWRCRWTTRWWCSGRAYLRSGPRLGCRRMPETPGAAARRRAAPVCRRRPLAAERQEGALESAQRAAQALIDTPANRAEPHRCYAAQGVARTGP